MGMAVGLAQGVEDIKLDDKLLPPLIIFTSYPLRVIAAIYIGCWIGTRSRSYVLAIVACSIALGTGQLPVLARYAKQRSNQSIFRRRTYDIGAIYNAPA